MKIRNKILIVVFACIMAVILCATSVRTEVVSAMETNYIQSEHGVFVTGTASVKAYADECVFGGVTESIATDIADAQKHSIKIFDAVKQAFSPYGDVSQSSFSVYPQGSGKCVTVYLSFRTAFIDKLPEIRVALTEAGVTRLNGVTYLCKDSEAYKTMALKSALENARNKAVALGYTGEPVYIEELSWYGDSYGSTEEGTIIYTATVKALFSSETYSINKG